MTATIAETEPRKFTIGDTVTWKRTDQSACYPATGWKLHYALVKTGTRIQLAWTTHVVASGNDFLVTLTSMHTAAFAAGKYDWQAYVTKNDDSERYKIDAGTLEILDDFDSASGGFDNRSYARQMLDNIEALLIAKAAGQSLDVTGYSTPSGRSISKMSIAELRVERDKYKAEVSAEESAERIANGLGSGKKILTRFRKGY